MNSFAAICTYFFIISDILNIFECKVGFHKDMSMDIVFPPVIKHTTSSSIPLGHLRPLGYQRKPSGKVKEILDMPDAHSFEMKYIKQNRPVVIREALKDLPVFTTWNEDKYLKDKFGNLSITTTIKKQLQRRVQSLMQFKKFLLDYMYDDWWLATTMPKEMADELPLPDCLRCGSYRQRLQEAELWMSSGGTASLLHSHDDHNIHCVLFGRKDFIVIDGQYKSSFDYTEKYHNAGSGFSKLDMDMINMFKNKDIANIPWSYATINQGDCILIPAGYLHQVRSYGRGISFSILFAPSRVFDSSDCKLTTEVNGQKKEEKLSDAAYVWVVRDSERQISAMNMEPSILKKYLDLLLRSDDEIHYEKFEHFFEDALEQYPDHVSAREAFDVLTDKPGQTKLTREQLENIKPNKLVHLSRIFNDARTKQGNFVRDEL